jgi:hypothetical protein
MRTYRVITRDQRPDIPTLMDTAIPGHRRLGGQMLIAPLTPHRRGQAVLTLTASFTTQNRKRGTQTVIDMVIAPTRRLDTGMLPGLT